MATYQNQVEIDEHHIRWLEELQEEPNFKRLNDWERNFIVNLAENIEANDWVYLSERQEGKLREIAFEILVF